MLQGRLFTWYPKVRPLQPPNCRETGTLKPGLYGPPTVEAGSGLNSAVDWHVGGPICLTGTIGFAEPEYICIVELLYTASLPELLAQFLATVNAAAGGQSQLLPMCT